MADPNLIATSVKPNAAFASASKPAPVLSIQVKPEVIPEIIKNLGALQGRTDDSAIVQKGSTYSFVDKRDGAPLAELNTETAKLTMYKSPKDMAERIDSAFIKEGTINKFLKESSASTPPASQPSLQVAAAQPSI